MSQENVERVTRSLEHWLDGRIGEWTETLDTDIEWDISGYPLPDFPDSGSGRDALSTMSRVTAAGGTITRRRSTS